MLLNRKNSGLVGSATIRIQAIIAIKIVVFAFLQNSMKIFWRLLVLAEFCMKHHLHNEKAYKK